MCGNLHPGIVELRTAGRERPLFLTHLHTGDVSYGARLAHEIDPQIPVYGLSLADPADAVGSMERLADRHIRSMRRIQPHGPYRIAGWSFGGLVAYEVARQLIGHDETVEFLGLLNTSTAATLAGRRPKSPDGARSVERALLEAQARYTPQPIPVTVMFFSAADAGSDPSRGWSAVLGCNLRITKVSGDHLEMMTVHVADLAREISAGIQESARTGNGHEPAYKPLVVLQSSRVSIQAPIFCAPGAGASVTSFLPFAAELPGARVVGLHAHGWDAAQVPHLSVEAAANIYVQSILSAEPRRPYRLVGHSFGGWVVFEMARRFAALQAQVAPLVLLDVDPPSPPDALPWKYDPPAAITKLACMLGRTAGTDLGVNRCALEKLDYTEQVQALMSAMKSAKVLPKSAPLAYVRNLVQVFIANLNTLYRPESAFSGPVLLFQTQDVDDDDDESSSPEQRAARWRRYAPNLEVAAASGNHMTMLQGEHIEKIIRSMQRAWQAWGRGTSRDALTSTTTLRHSESP